MSASESSLHSYGVEKPETKKDLILTLARRDPFLTIDEIAREAGTTARYVRTILSEAKLSLMELRKRYARTMQRRLGVDVVVPDSSRGLTQALASAGRHVGVNQLGVVRAVNSELAQALRVAPDTPLLILTRLRLVDNEPFFVNQIVTNQVLTVDTEVMENEKPLRQALGLEIPGRTRFVERSIEVVPADESLAHSLGLEPGEPLLKSGNLIVTDDEPVGIEYNYFGAYRVRFVLTSATDYSLQVIEKTG